MHWMKKVAFALGLSVLGAFACVTFRNSVEDKLPLTVIRALREPDSFEILALDPMAREERGAADKPIPPDKDFHGFEILGHAPLNDAAARSELVELVLQGIQESDGTVAACFIPRHGIRAVKEGKVLDLVICYECLQVEIHFAELTEEGGRLGVLTSLSVEPEVTRIYHSAGLRIAGR
jgi:hypothetical protein